MPDIALQDLPADTSPSASDVIAGDNGTATVVYSLANIKTFMSASPTLVTPALGTPASGTLTNCTGLPVASGVSGLGTGVATFLATPSSANLAAAVTGETGTGALVFGTGPTLSAPVLGTPASGTLTNCTGLPVSTGVAGLGTGVATFLATPSSANLRAALTDEVGTGAAYFVGGALGTPASGTLTNATGLPLASGVTGVLPLANGGTGAALSDPGADRLFFWDDSAGAVTFLTLGTNLSITGTTINASGSGGVAWGSISGTLSDQTDLQGELDAKADALTSGTTINASRALASTDVGRMTDVDTSGGAVVLTLNTGAILDNEVMTFRRVGANALTIVSGTGTVNNPDGVLANNGSIISLIGVGTDAGTLVGFVPAGTPADGSITLAKLADLAQDQFIGRTTASTGVPQTATITAAARTVLDDASVGDMVNTLGGATSTGTGGLARATSPTFVTPALGTPASGVATNLTGLPLTTGVTGTLPVANGGTGRATSTTAYGLIAAGTTATGAHQTLAAGATTEILVGGGASALPVWTTATGTGAPVRATSPTLVTPALGTPSAAVLTNATGLPISTGVAGLGAGVATFLATPSSANLAAAVTDETGSGALVFATSPTLVTPVLGTPTSGNLSNCTVDGTDQVGFRNIPINSQSTAYTAVLADAGKCLYHPSADTTARTFTIPANGSVAYPIGTTLMFDNDAGAGALTIAINTDTLVLVGATGSTGSRTLASGGRATAVKVTSTRWRISGTAELT